VVFALLLLSLLIAGCGPRESIEDIDYFSVTLHVENEGAFSLRRSPIDGSESLSAKVTLMYDPLYFQEVESDFTSSDAGEIYLDGKSAYWPGGESRLVTVGLLRANPLKTRLGADTEIMVGLCYPYETLLATEVCVDGDVFDDDTRSQVCQASDLSFVDQGAPVAITNVEVQNLPVGTIKQPITSQQPVVDNDGVFVGTRDVVREEIITVVKPVFKLTLQNVGDGQVVRGRDVGRAGACLKMSEDDYPTASVVVTGTLGSRELACLNPAPTLFDGSAEVTCMVKDGDDLAVVSNYKDYLQVRLSYMYQSRISATVKVEDTVKQYEPALVLTSRCDDFDGQYELCKSFGQQGAGLGLDCYYCDASDKCLENKGLCENGACATGREYDVVSRRCVGACPLTPPRVSATVNRNTGSVEVACSDSVPAIDFHRCGCGEFMYKFVQNSSDCDDYPYGYAKKSGTVASSSVKASISLEEASDTDRFMCIVGLTNSQSSSDPRAVSISAAR
jgi:hypothetical protein